MSALFADTYYFVALLNRNDQYHQRAIEFDRGHRGLLTTEWVLTEVADLLVKERTRRYVMPLIRDLRGADDCEIVAFSGDVFEKAQSFYDQHCDKEWTLTDCTSFLVMQERGITEALTGDHHFEQAGFTALLK
jgi:predicted nucleic acid-binding protein